MAWSQLVDAKIKMDDSYDKAELVIVGAMAPPAAEDNDDADVPTMTLMGTAKEIDESLNGALSNLIKENNKTFKNGATAGSTMPTVQVMEGLASPNITLSWVWGQPQRMRTMMNSNLMEARSEMLFVKRRLPDVP
jgi:hypothetical protein